MENINSKIELPSTLYLEIILGKTTIDFFKQNMINIFDIIKEFLSNIELETPMAKIPNYSEISSEEQLIEIIKNEFEILCEYIDSEKRIEYIDELNHEQSLFVIEWLEECFISTFTKIEEFEKCAKIRDFIKDIKEIKQI